MLVPGSVAVYLPLWIASGESVALGVWSLGGALLLALGAAIYAWCIWDFARFGRGTPAPIDAPKVLVVRGLFRLVRNPIYVGVLSAILGWALLFASPRLLLYAVVVWIWFHLFVLLYEEPTLRRLFGESYLRYCTQVPRWIPRFKGERP